jgi:hypothetical protein
MNLHKDILECIINFLNEININVVEIELNNDTFLPGLSIKGDTILMDKKRLKYPWDLLHEAGHIAVTEERLRGKIGTKEIADNWPTDGDEIAAILWSYAALYHLNLDIEIVFHPGGYKNESEWLIQQFTNKNYIGLPLLEWMGFCNQEEEFPKMKKWLR